MVELLLGTGLRCPELVGLDLHQVQPSTPAEPGRVKKAKLVDVRGKDRTQRAVFLGLDSRLALATTSNTNAPLMPTHTRSRCSSPRSRSKPAAPVAAYRPAP